MNLENEWHDLGSSDINGDNVKLSDARDNELKRLGVIKYSETIKNDIANTLASPYRDPENKGEIEKLMNNTFMYADTSKLKINIEYNTTEASGLVRHEYIVKGIDLGVEERPKTSIELEKEITGVKLDLNDGTPIVDIAAGLSNNVMIVKNKTRYDNKGKYSIYFDITKIGQGAVITIDYRIIVKNSGEVDTVASIPVNLTNVSQTNNTGEYLGNTYYTGKEGLNTRIVETKVDRVIDYVDNDLIFVAEDNSDWAIVEQSTLETGGMLASEVIKSLKEKEHKNLIQTTALNRELKPGESAQVNVKFVRTMTGKNEQSDLTYDNTAEILQYTNAAGRRDSLLAVKEGYLGAIPGNQDPYKNPQEHDTDFVEEVTITDSYGEEKINYGLIALVSVILILGIVAILKFVIRPKRDGP